MLIQVDDSSPMPPYEQIRAQIWTMIRSGVLPPGARLPAIRQLAADLGLATGTVARAYRELEREGLIGGRGRRGSSVRPLPAPASGPDASRSEAAAEAARRFALAVRQLGLDPTEALERARRELETLELREPAAD